MTAIILAGGKSSRMGFDKAFLKIDGIPLIKRQIKLLKDIFGKIIIVTNNPRKYKLRSVRVVQDIIPNKGPLGGIYSGLKVSGSLYNFIVACDMPFLNENLVRYLIKNKEAYDIIIPKINKKFHPLFGIYSKNCIPIIEERLSKDKLKISNIFAKLKTYFISRKEIERFDRRMLSLVNINTKEDLVKTKKI